MDLPITAANVAPILTSINGNIITRITTGTAGAAITAGQLVYLNNQMQFMLANALDPVASVAVGVALTSAAVVGQPLQVAIDGDMIIGATSTMTVTSVFIVSGNNQGGMAPIGDSATGWYPGTVGIAISPTVVRLGIVGNNGIAHS